MSRKDGKPRQPMHLDAPGFRESLVLMCKERLTNDEIAAMTGLCSATIRYYRRFIGMPARPGTRGTAAHREASRRGGLTTAARYGTEHYARAGAVGGRATLAKYGPEFLSRIAREAATGRVWSAERKRHREENRKANALKRLQAMEVGE